ncbi:MAG: sodium:solute symporter family protein [Ruminococcaceae bacterium]|nr:sodium:solute symporter family protein [Oscillospiraceae bacterium]
MAIIKYLFVAAYVVFILVVGLRSRRDSAGGGDAYLLGGRSIGPVITSFSFAATYISGVCMVNAGKIGWDWGIGAMWNAWGNVLLSIVFMWFCLGARSRSMSEKLNVQTLPDFLRARYQSEFFKLVGSIVMFIFMIPYTAAVFSSLSYMFTRVFGLPYLGAVIAMAILAAVYLVVGGYKAAAKIDVIQGGIMVIGGIILAVATVSAKEVGGLAAGMQRLRELGPFTNTAGVEATGAEIASFGMGGNWGLLMGIIPFVLMTSWAPSGLPQMATKFFAIRDAKQVRIGAIVCTILGFIIITGVHVPGLFIHLFYDTLPEGGTNVLVPDLLTRIFGSGLGGQLCLSLILLLVLSASMSTLAGLVLTSSAALGMDILKGYCMKDLDEKKTTTMLRVCTLFFVLAALVLALLNLGVISSIQSLAWGAISGFFLAPYVYGTMSRRVTKAGAIAGSLIGLGCAVLIPTLVKSAVPSIARWCTTVNACAIATVLPLILTPIISAFTKKQDKAYVDRLFSD